LLTSVERNCNGSAAERLAFHRKEQASQILIEGRSIVQSNSAGFGNLGFLASVIDTFDFDEDICAESKLRGGGINPLA
jgi:hypothetical protein